MSSISFDAPTLLASVDNMKDFLSFVYTHESILKKYGAIKIVPPSGFKTNLKKYRMKLEQPSTIQQITQSHQSDLIYSVTTVPCVSQKEPKELIPVSESDFWVSLSQHNNQQQIASVSTIPTQSFFLKEVHRIDFSIHRLPRQSLLKFCNKNLLREFVPSLTRTHGPGGIFPLASARQHLFTFNYHHVGGNRYWYIIPASERKALERIFQQQTNSVCLDHGHILIDPSTFDKYNIRYHKLIQEPNEIVILAAGVLSQSFTGNASWSETIDFALPSWLDDGHSNVQITCSCKPNLTLFPTVIDTKAFNPVLIQRYIRTCLSIIIDDTSPSHTNEQKMETDKMSIFSDISLPSVDHLSNQILEPSTNNSPFDNQQIDNNNHQALLGLSIDSNFLRESYESPYSTISDHFPTSFESNNLLSTSQDFYDETVPLTNEKPHLLTYREILNIISSPPSTIKSVESQSEEKMDDQQEILNSPTINCQNIDKKSNDNWNTFKHRKQDYGSNTLLISGLKNDVTKYDLYNHFSDCKRLKIKQSKVPPYLNYAFILYRTNQNAENNRQRPIDHRIFGENCRVEYANKNFNRYEEYQPSNKWKIVVRRIPENVSEEYLYNLFKCCHSLSYRPARIVSANKSKNPAINKNKILLGYAFVYYNDGKDAANAVNNFDKFKINDQPLHVSFFNAMNSSSIIRQHNTSRRRRHHHRSSEMLRNSSSKYQ